METTVTFTLNSPHREDVTFVTHELTERLSGGHDVIEQLRSVGFSGYAQPLRLWLYDTTGIRWKLCLWVCEHVEGFRGSVWLSYNGVGENEPVVPLEVTDDTLNAAGFEGAYLYNSTT